MSKRVLPKGLIMNQNQSSTGAPTIGGVGARTISNRRAILINAVHPTAEMPYIPMISNVIGINNGVLIYFHKLQRGMTYEYQIIGDQTINKVNVTEDNKYILITGLTNTVSYNIRLRSVNIDQRKSDWLNINNIIPQLTQTSITSVVGVATFQPPKGAPVSYLIVGGGGGGGGSYDTGTGGGGGAGMVLTGSFTSYGIVYTANVGDGGDGGAGENDGASGISSSISGVGIALGGLGGYRSRAAPGGTGIGGNAASPPTLASGGGNGGGSQLTSIGSGGGGGSAGAGGNATATGGAGGAGTTVTIGSVSGTYGVGGAGRNNVSNGNGAAGADNTGNGGQGAGSTSADTDNGGKGGSGIVIIAY
jgi:hypothetical protein